MSVDTATPRAKRSDGSSPARVADADRLGTWLTWGLGLAVVLVVVVFRKGQLDAFARPKYQVLAVTSITLAGLAGLRVWRRGSMPAIRVVPDVLVGAYVLWNLLAYAASEVRGVSLHGEPFQYQGLAAVLLYALGYGLIRFVPDRSALPLAVVVAGAIAAGYGLLQYVGADPLWDVLYKDRIFSTFGQPNSLAAFLVMALPFGIVLALQPAGVLRSLGRVATPVIVVGLFLTMSRGGYVAFGVATVASAALVLRHVPRRVLVRGVVVSLVALAGLVAVPLTRPAVVDVVDRASSIAGPLDSSNDKRVDLWRVGAAISADHPWLGVGHEVYPERFHEYAATTLDEDGWRALAPYRPESPHNVYIATAVNAGLPALGLYLAFIGWALVEAGRRFRADANLLAGAVFFALVAHVVTDAFVTAETATSWIFWLLIGWLAATRAPRPTRTPDTLSSSRPDIRKAGSHGP